MGNCIDCGKPVTKKSKRCMKCANTQANNPNWCGGLDKEKYSKTFTNEVRDQIRFRDKFTCQVCGKKRIAREEFKLEVHHIDYGKSNTSSKNLVALCKSCHIKTNYDREKWIKYFKDLFINRGIIR
jgi:5-methylcytosine-specific restriction endonuclease McrA